MHFCFFEIKRAVFGPRFYLAALLIVKTQIQAEYDDLNVLSFRGSLMLVACTRLSTPKPAPMRGFFNTLSEILTVLQVAAVGGKA